MKKIIAGIAVLTFLASCVERDDVLESEKEKTNLKHQNIEALKKESDSLEPVFSAPKTLEPGTGIDPGDSPDPGEVGPIVTTPPK